MMYTVGEMAKLLNIPGSTLRIMTRKGFFPSWSVLPAASACFRRRITNG